MTTKLRCASLLFGLFLGHEARAQGLMTPRARDGEVPMGALTLASESLRVQIDHQYARSTLQQTYVNRSAQPLEGRYELRVGEGGAVDGFAYWNGEKKIVGEVFERETARAVYEQQTGLDRDPGLLEESGEGAFTFRVFPIQPQERKRVEVRFGRRLLRVGQTVEYRLPLFADASTEQDCLIEISDERPLRAVRSPSHRLEFLGPPTAQTQAGLRPTKTGLEVPKVVRVRALRDPHKSAQVANPGAPQELVLQYDLEEPPLQVSALVHRDAGQDAYVSVQLALPPAGDAPAPSAKDVTLVIDHSGSMSGQPLEQAKAAAAAVVQRLRPQDRVNVLLFDDRVEPLYDKPRRLSDAVRGEALAFIARTQAGGGTNIALALTRALAAQERDSQPDLVLFFTDGQSSAQEALAAAGRDQGDARVFTIGLGGGVEKPLLSRLAQRKRGRFTFIESAAAIKERVTRLFAQIESPVLLDVSVEVSGARLHDGYPRTLPDLASGDELVFAGRLVGSGPVEVKVRGRMNDRPVSYQTRVTLPAQVARPFVGQLWARARVEDLLEEIALSGEQDELKNEVINLALAYNLVTRYTAFLAVPESELTESARDTLAGARERKRAVYEAHKDAVALSRSAMPPGDPLLTLRAPADAVQVTAFFPFGLVKDLRYDASLEQWQVRFLVPKGVADGVYQARVVLVHRDGRVEIAQVPYTIDSAAPDFVAQVVPVAGGLRLRVQTREAAARVVVAVVGAATTRIELVEREGQGAQGTVFTGALPLAAGSYQLRVVVSDEARNEAEQVLTAEVR